MNLCSSKFVASRPSERYTSHARGFQQDFARQPDNPESPIGSWEKVLYRARISHDLAPSVNPQVTRKAVIDELRDYIREVGTSPKLDDIAARLDVNRAPTLSKYDKWPTLLEEVGAQRVRP